MKKIICIILMFIMIVLFNHIAIFAQSARYMMSDICGVWDADRGNPIRFNADGTCETLAEAKNGEIPNKIFMINDEEAKGTFEIIGDKIKFYWPPTERTDTWTIRENSGTITLECGYGGYIIYKRVGAFPNQTTSFGSKVSDWAKEEVEEAYDKGLVPEVLEGKDLTQKVNRAEFAAIAVVLYEELSGKRATVGYNPFYDISGNVCEDDILKAYNLDITIGVSNTKFEPNINISREQVATMLTRAYKKSEFSGWTIETDGDYALNYMGVKKFADDAQISDYAKESVYFMVRWDIIQGVGDNKFAPKGSVTLGDSYGFATREQAIVIALRSKKHL